MYSTAIKKRMSIGGIVSFSSSLTTHSDDSRDENGVVRWRGKMWMIWSDGVETSLANVTWTHGRASLQRSVTFTNVRR